MANRKVAALVAAPVVPASVGAEQPIDRADVLKRLAVASAKERVLILSALPMGEVAAIGGKIAGIGSSVYEVLNIKMSEKHGADWAHIAKALPSALGDADKERRKAIIASLESIRETVKTNAGGDAQKGSDALKRVKEWGLGIRQSKSKPKGNEKRELREFLVSWDALPSLYRRIMADENADDTDMVFADAIAAWFTSRSISPKAVLDCTGRSAWNVK